MLGKEAEWQGDEKETIIVGEQDFTKVYQELSQDNQFYRTGNVVLPNSPLLFWDKEKHVCSDLGKLDALLIENILKVATKSGFGNLKTLTTEYDDKVRDAYEIDCKHIHQNIYFDPEVIGLFGHGDVATKAYKTTIYKEGGFFKSHTDSCTSSDLLGTVVWMFRPAEEGGQFRVKDVVIPMDKPGDWCFIYGDCEHEVLPVVKGTRVAMIFQVFATSTREESQLYQTFCNKSTATKINVIFDQIEIGQTLFGTHHEYAGFPAPHELKGIDYFFFCMAVERFGEKNVEIFVGHAESETQYINQDHDSGDETDLYVSEYITLFRKLKYENLQEYRLYDWGEVVRDRRDHDGVHEGKVFCAGDGLKEWKAKYYDWQGFCGNCADELTMRYLSAVIRINKTDSNSNLT